MKLAALLSGGKDSLYAAYLAKKEGHEIASIVSIRSENPASYMFHVPNVALVRLQAEAMGIPIVTVETKGEKEKELEDLKAVLAKLSTKSRAQLKAVKANATCPRCGAGFDCDPAGSCWCKTEEYALPLKLPIPGIKGCLCPACLKQLARVDGIVTGAIASKYQKSRIDNICKELGLESIAPLWGHEPEGLLKAMIDAGFEIIITAVAAGGLGEEWLGKKLDSKAADELIQLSKKHRFSPVGEGGEFETLVLDCPLFGKRINIIEAKKHWDAKTRSGVYEITKAELAKK